METLITKRSPISALLDRIDNYVPPKWAYPIIYNKKKILIFSILFAIFITFAMALCLPDLPENVNPIAQPLKAMIDDIFTVDSDNFFTKNLDVSFNGSTISLGDESISYTSGVVASIANYFKSFGVFLLLVYWGVSFYDMLLANNHQLIAEQMAKKFLYLIIGLALVSNAPAIVFAITNIGSVAIRNLNINDIASNAPELDDAISGVYQELVIESGFLGAGWLGSAFSSTLTGISYLIQLFVPWLITKICNILVSVVCWSRVVEICILAMLSPAMFADIGNENAGFLHTNAFRAMKNVLSLALSGVVIYASLYLCSALSADRFIDTLTTTGFTAMLGICYDQLIISVVKIGTISKASQMAKQALGMA